MFQFSSVLLCAVSIVRDGSSQHVFNSFSVENWNPEYSLMSEQLCLAPVHQAVSSPFKE